MANQSALVWLLASRDMQDRENERKKKGKLGEREPEKRVEKEKSAMCACAKLRAWHYALQLSPH